MNRTTLGILVMSLIALLGISTVSAVGFGKGFMNSNLTDKEKTELQAQREAMQTAISEGDYEAWSSLMQEKIAKMQESITEENFNKITEMHQQRVQFRDAMQEARETGDFSKIEELKEQYGIVGKPYERGHFRMFNKNLVQ
ncbi:MAG: hypothetical protein ABIB47_04065 [Candidatus Woesearchaeota archaeon]